MRRRTDHTAATGRAAQGGNKPLGRRARIAARNASQAGAMMTKTARRSSRGQSPQLCRHPGDPRLHREARAASRGPRRPRRRRRYTDSASRDRALKGDGQDDGKHTQTEDARGEGHEHRAECLCSWLTPSLRVFRGGQHVQPARGYRVLSVPAELSSAERLRTGGVDLAGALDPAMASRAKKGEFVTVF